MKKIKLGTRMIQIGMVICLIESLYFGWHEKPINDLELYIDNIVKFFWYSGFILYIIPAWRLYENAIKNYESNKSKNQN